jgi:hypothetical protein
LQRKYAVKARKQELGNEAEAITTEMCKVCVKEEFDISIIFDSCHLARLNALCVSITGGSAVKKMLDGVV